MILALLLAQLALPTPVHIATPTPAPISERTALSHALEDAQARAAALGGTLGAVVLDLGNGATAEINGDSALPMQSVQKLPIAVMIYRSIDAGKLAATQSVTIVPADVVRNVSVVGDGYPKRTAYTIEELVTVMLEQSDNTAANALLRVLGGPDAANARLRELHYDGILVAAADAGYAKPFALASFLSDLHAGKLLSASSHKTVLSMMAKSVTFPGRLRAGFPKSTVVEHKTGTSATSSGVTDATNDVGIVELPGRTLVIVAMLHGAKGDDATRDALLASVARAAYDATRQFPL